MDPTYLVFGFRGARYGVDVRAVREIVWLPALSPIEELPPYVVGVFNLRGRVVPVMDLGLRFGHARERYQPSDHVVVIEAEGARVGIVAGELHDVAQIAHAAIDDVECYQGAGGHAQFVSGEARLDAQLVMLLEVEALLHGVPPEDALALPDSEPETPASSFEPASAEEGQVLRERAERLARVQDSDERVGLQAYAVIGLDGELFGLGVGAVREFTHLRNVAPVPCCPPHIVGNMNLRGDVLTLVDIRPLLGIPIEGKAGEVAVLRSGELSLGVPAAQIVDVIYLAPGDIGALPVGSGGASGNYCMGVAAIGNRTVSLLDVEKLLAARELRVEETPNGPAV